MFFGPREPSPLRRPKEVRKVRVGFFREQPVLSPPHEFITSCGHPQYIYQVTFNLKDYQEALKQLEETGHGIIGTEYVQGLCVTMKKKEKGVVKVDVSATGISVGCGYSFDTSVEALQLPEISANKRLA